MTALTADLVGIGLTSQQAKMLGDTQANSITANGTTQGTATPITASINQVTVVTAANNGVILPLAASTPYSWIMIRNTDSADVINVWPAVGDAIQSLVNTPVGVNAGTGKIFCKINSSGWVNT
jgi:hypothetical protein